MLKRLIDRDYDESSNSFYDPQVVPVYGSMLVKIINSLTDIAIEQSFFSNIEDPKKDNKSDHDDADDDDDYSGDEDDRPSSSANNEQRDQNRLLTLLKYILKTVNLKTLVKCGFNRVHVQFLIINFSLSRLTPKVGLKSNLRPELNVVN